MNARHIIETRPRITPSGWIWIGIAAFSVGWIALLTVLLRVHGS